MSDPIEVPATLAVPDADAVSLLLLPRRSLDSPLYDILMNV
jgi:hypothetical protein